VSLEVVFRELGVELHRASLAKSKALRSPSCVGAHCGRFEHHVRALAGPCDLTPRRLRVRLRHQEASRAKEAIERLGRRDQAETEDVPAKHFSPSAPPKPANGDEIDRDVAHDCNVLRAPRRLVIRSATVRIPMDRSLATLVELWHNRF
jgi:hypothetical protein